MAARGEPIEISEERCSEGGWIVVTIVKEPALNPNQPKHVRPSPRMESGNECGLGDDSGQPLRRPNMRQSTNADDPEVMWTTEAPAKSKTPRLASHPFPKTHLATKQYTKMDQKKTKQAQNLKRMRPATAPPIKTYGMLKHTRIELRYSQNIQEIRYNNDII